MKLARRLLDLQLTNSSPLPDHHMPSQSIGTRLKEQMLILFLVPFVFFLVASTIHLNRLFLEQESIRKIDVSISQTVALKNILHELQNERGMSLLYVSSEGKKFERQLLAQHRKTDQLIEQVAKLNFFSQGSSSHILDLTAQAKALVSLRPRILALEMSSDEVLENYSNKSQSLIRFIRRVVIDDIDTELTRPLITLLTFINLKELMGVERALLASVFTLDHFSKGNYQRFVKLEAERKKYVEIFLSLSDLPIQYGLSGFISPHLHQKVEAYRRVAHDRANVGNFNIDATQWFNAMTTKIEQLKLLESTLSDELTNLSYQRCLQRKQQITLWLLGLASVAFITAVCGVAFTKRINRSISVQLQEYNTLFEHSSGAMVIIDPHSKQILYCNSQFLALSGYDEPHINSLFLSNLFKLDDVEETLRLYGNIAKGDFSFIEDVLFYCAKEQMKTVEVATFPIVLKNKNYMVLNIKDVSERIETKKYFEKSQVALQVVLNHLEYAVSVVDASSGQVIYLNDRAVDIFRDRNQVEPLWHYLSLQGNGKSDTTLSCEYTQQRYHKTSKRWY